MSSDVRTPRGVLMVVSAPSGTGKTTVVERLVERRPQVARSRSYTSRAPRTGEVNGVDYDFISRQTFEAMAGRGEFLEWADIFGNLYGTGRASTEATLAKGIDLVLVIDVQGARQVRAALPEAVAVFVLPPSYAALAERLRGRNSDSSGSIETRLTTARQEITAVEGYDYVLVNDDLERCLDELDAILVAERSRIGRRRAVIGPILETFRDR